jgi:hypothetical protein
MEDASWNLKAQPFTLMLSDDVIATAKRAHMGATMRSGVCRVITYARYEQMYAYRVTLNGEDLGSIGKLDAAKARAEREIWHRVRLMSPGMSVDGSV